jgi:hypothetical protein
MILFFNFHLFIFLAVLGFELRGLAFAQQTCYPVTHTSSSLFLKKDGFSPECLSEIFQVTDFKGILGAP